MSVASAFVPVAGACGAVLGVTSCTSIAGLEQLDFSAAASGVQSAASSSGSGGGAAGGSGGDGNAAGSGGAGGGSAATSRLVDLGSVSIDATEVTHAQYFAFLATRPAPGDQPSYCNWNLSFEPTTIGSSGGPDRPVAGVDWCDAYAYCAWANKRLCGAIGGGTETFASFSDATHSQWHFACTNDLATSYTYGNGYEPKWCVGSDFDGLAGVQASDVAVDVGSAFDCHGFGAPFDQVFDLSGNVAEWTDSCDGTTGPEDKCRRRGGSFSGNSNALQCEDDSMSNRESTGDASGFRCCGGQ